MEDLFNGQNNSVILNALPRIPDFIRANFRNNF